MSGGYWDYIGYKIENALTEISEDEHVQHRWPGVSRIFKQVAPVLKRLEYEMDWDLSADSWIPDDTAWDLAACAALVAAVTPPVQPRFHLRIDSVAGHVHASLFSDGGLAGTLTLRPHEAEALAALIGSRPQEEVT